MHSWWWSRTSALLLFGIFVLSAFVFSTVSLDAQSTTVELTVPQTKIITKGRASPGAQVVVYVDGSESASAIANTHGMYSIHINNLSAGVYKIAVEAIDVQGVISARAQREVAVNLQQTSIVNFFLAPTVVATPSSRSFGENRIQFRGYTARNAQVRIRIGNGSTVLKAQANNQGFYQTSLTTNTLAVGIFNYRAEAQVGANVSEPDTLVKQFTITPPISSETPTSPGELTSTPSQQVPLTDSLVPSQPPRISTPDSGSDIDGSSVVLSGTASPNSEILVYEAGELIGVVLASQTGNWQFYFQATREVHRFRIQECIEDDCSDFSDEIELNFGLIRGECVLDLRLSQYRLTASPNQTVNLTSLSSLVGPNIFAVVNWGDSSEQRFNIDSGNLLTADYVYDETGIYNGYVIVTDADNCTDTVYFTVRVSDSPPLLTVVFVGLSLTAVGLIAVSLIVLYRRFI